MSAISTFLNQIKTAIYGEQVRDAIHDAIAQCYTDVSNAKTIADNSNYTAQQSIQQANSAVDAANAAQQTADNAIAQVTAARDTTVQAKDDAVAAKNDSVAAKEASVEARNDVALLAEQVSNDKSEVAGFKQDASDSATNAANSETLAAGSAQTADDIRVAIEEMFQTVEMEIPERVKTALLNCFQHLAWVDADGKRYYDALVASLEPPVVDSIVAVFDQGDHKVYTVDTLDSLRKYLDVKALYTNGKQAYTRGYTLSGNLTAGSSRISVAYSGQSTSFAVSVTAMTVRSISCVYQQSGVVYDSDDLDVLRKDLAITAYFNNGSAQILDDLNYSLSGNLSVGTSTITVTYGGKTTTFTVTVTDTSVTIESISCVYNQSGTVLATDSLDVLKADLVVTAHYSNSTEQVIDALNYELSGTLSGGTSTITVTYEGKTATFNVLVEETGLLYRLPSVTELNGVDDYVDTNIQLMKTKQSFTIVSDFYEDNGVLPSDKMATIFHCMLEDNVNYKYPGISCHFVLHGSNKFFQSSYNGNTSSSIKSIYHEFPNVSLGHARYTCSVDANNNSMIVCVYVNGELAVNERISGISFASVNETLLIGAYRTSDDVKGRFFKGTINEFKVYDHALSQDECVAYVTEV